MSRIPTGGRFDVCNGDADGLCAVRQWRLHQPAQAVLVTGLKREIALLRKVPPERAREVLVCDLSVARNRDALVALLAAGARVRYFDHHDTAGELPASSRLEAHVDTRSGTCTSLLMDRCLGGLHRPWALAGAYGDQMGDVADSLARASGLDAGACATLRRLGELINYNAYGDSLADVRLAPREMHALMMRHTDAFALAREPVFDELGRQRADDRARATALTPRLSTPQACVLLLPDAAWSRRVAGSLANELAAATPRQAQAVLSARADGGWRVSVRSPRVQARGAAAVCARFGGSGREAAAGIDQLPADALDAFVDAFATAWTAAGS